MSARILGLDISTCTGYGFWETSRHISSIEAGVIELPKSRKIPNTDKKDRNWDDWRVAQVGPKTVNLIRKFKPDLILVEERLRFSKTGDDSFAMSQAIHGAVYSHCCSFNLLFGTIPVGSWRAAAYGGGFKPQLLPDLDRNGKHKIDPETGKPSFKKQDWGDIAVAKCDSLGISLPSKKTIAHNAAEAALIAMVWRCQKRISIPGDRNHQRFVALLQGRMVEGREAA